MNSNQLKLDISYEDYLKLKKHPDATFGVDGDASKVESIMFICEEKSLCICSKFKLLALEGAGSQVLLSEVQLINPIFGEHSDK